MIITDIETNGLLDTVSKFHCAFIYDTALDEYIGFRPEDFEAYLHCLMGSAERGELIVFHNGIKYDIPALEILAKQRGITFSIPQENIIDTLVLARLIYSNIKETDMGRVRSGRLAGKMMGSQSLEAWGYRLGQMKGEYKYDFKAKLEEEGEEYKAGDEWLSFNEEMYDYCKQDVVVTYELTKKLFEHKWYNPDQKTLLDLDVTIWDWCNHSIKLEHEAAWLLAKMERNGFPFDKASMVRVYGELAEKRQELLKELQETFGSWYRPKGGTEYFRHPVTGKELPKYPKVKYPKNGSLFKKPKNKAQREGREPLERSKTTHIKGCPYTPVEHVVFNPSSREHIALKLQEAGWIPTEFTDNGTPIVNDDVLKHIKVDDPQKQKCIDLIATYLLVQKRIGQIAEGTNSWLNFEKDGKIHGSINPNGAVTGRCTHSFPNVAQVPSVSIDDDTDEFIFGLEGGWGTECRMAFGAEHHEGWVQVGVDASGLELRCLAHFMATYDNGEYVDVILNGDIHTKNQMAAGLPTRKMGKTFIYGFLYGAGDAKIGEIVGGDAKAGKALKEKFLENTPAIALLRDKIQNTLVESSSWRNGEQQVVWKRKYIKGLDGRMVNIRSPHAALNTLLQSAGALICKHWIVETEKLLKAQGLKQGFDGDYALMAYVHDECQWACKTVEIAETIKKTAQQAMRNTQEFFKFKCQLDTDGKIGKNWAECH